MKISILLTVLLFFTACLPIPQVIDEIEVRGEVQDNATAKPLPGAKIRLSCKEKFGTKKVTTDQNGRFKVRWGSHMKFYRTYFSSRQQRAKRTIEGNFKREGYEGEVIEDAFTPRKDLPYIDFGVVYLEPKR